MKSFLSIFFLGLVFAHPAVDLKPERKLTSESYRISFPEDISSPFINRQDVVADHYSHAVKALFEVVMRLKTVVGALDGGGGRGNFIVSPLSVAVALGQLLLGAGGETRRRLAEILTPLTGGRLDETLHRELGALLRLLQTTPNAHGASLDVAAAFFVQAGLPIRDSYRFSVNSLYGTDLLPLEFASDPRGSQQRVNSWVSQHTHGRIPSILPYPLPASTVAVLANSIYFSGQWEQPFDPQVSIQAPFHVTSKASVPVTLMRNSIETMYANSTSFSLVALPYLHQQAAMYIVLPTDKEKDINQFMSELSLKELHRVINSVEHRVVNIAMPKMTLSMTFSLREPLAMLHKTNQRNERLVPSNASEDKTTPQGTVHNTSCNGSGHNCEHLTESKNTNKTYMTFKSEQTNATQLMSTLYRGGDISKFDSDRVPARLIGKQHSISNDSQKLGTETVGTVPRLHETNINSASINNSDRKPTDLSPKWIRTLNKTVTVKPSSTASSNTVMERNNNAKPFSTKRVTAATTAKPSRSSTNRPAKESSNLLLDMTGASDDPRFRVDDIIHQSWLEVTEAGTEAAAATVTAVDYSGDSVVFLVNRPFFFFIRHEITLAPIFWGVISDPTSGSVRLSRS